MRVMRLQVKTGRRDRYVPQLQVIVSSFLWRGGGGDMVRGLFPIIVPGPFY
jgi:hypothetical protein